MAVTVARCIVSLQTFIGSVLLLLNGSSASGVLDITAENFPSVLEGEWMLEL